MNKPPIDDWLRHVQEKYLKRAKLIARDYCPYKPGWDHDNCTFCEDKFSMHKRRPLREMLKGGRYC